MTSGAPSAWGYWGTFCIVLWGTFCIGILGLGHGSLLLVATPVLFLPVPPATQPLPVSSYRNLRSPLPLFFSFVHSFSPRVPRRFTPTDPCFAPLPHVPSKIVLSCSAFQGADRPHWLRYGLLFGLSTILCLLSMVQCMLFYINFVKVAAGVGGGRLPMRGISVFMCSFVARARA